MDTTNSIMWLMICLALSLLSRVYGGATLEIRLREFINVNGLDYTGAYCDETWMFGKSSDCDHKFVLCVDNKNSTDSTSSCEFFREVLGPYRDKDTVTFRKEPYSIPLTSWPGEVKLKVQVYDNDYMTADDFVGNLTGIIAATVGSKWKKQFIVADQKTKEDSLRLIFEYKVSCDKFYYGDTCTVMCKPPDDFVRHYTCGDDGRKICNPGWMGKECTDSIDECLHNPCENGGTCIDAHLSHSCVCATGFTGFKCRYDINECSQSTCGENSVNCTNTHGGYSCDCKFGWTGMNCDVQFDECLENPCKNDTSCVGSNSTSGCYCTEMRPECSSASDGQFMYWKSLLLVWFFVIFSFLL